MRLIALVVAVTACSSPLDRGAPGWYRLDVTGPGARWGHAAVYDPRRQVMVIFGGQSAAGELADVWTLDPNAETWRRLQTGPGPTQRVNAAALFDAAQDRMIVVGGRTGLTTLLDDVWALDFKTLEWSQLPSGPGPRQRMVAATDGTRGWFYGGEGFLRVFGDLWELDFATSMWRELPSGDVAPDARTCGAMAVSTIGLFITGGHGVAFVDDDTWRYDLTSQAWSRVATQGRTAAGAHWAYAVDPMCRTLYLAGGDHYDHYDTALTNTLSLDGDARFYKLAVSALPDPNDHATLVFTGSELVLYGGTLGDGGAYLDGTWVYPVPSCVL